MSASRKASRIVVRRSTIGQQLLVRDHDQRVHVLAQPLDPVLGLPGTLRALERERPRDHADGERTDLVLGDVSDHGRRARAGAAALAGGDEHHVGALQRLLDVVAGLGRRALADIRVGAGPEPLGKLMADVELDVGIAHRQRLSVGVGGDELDAAQTCVDHPVDRIGTAAADSDDLDDCEVTAAFH